MLQSLKTFVLYVFTVNLTRFVPSLALMLFCWAGNVALAFDSTDEPGSVTNTDWGNRSPNPCKINYRVIDSIQYAEVRIQTNDFGQGTQHYAGGTYYYGENPTTIGNPSGITREVIAYCLTEDSSPIDASNVSDLRQNGADATYSSDTFIGFAFILNTSVTGFDANTWYEYKVGSGTLVPSDTTSPTVALTSNANDPHSGVFTVTATFSEAVTGFDLGDITVGNGTAGNLSGSGTTYTFDVTPTADGTVTVDVAANVATDAATNGNTAATQLSVTMDGTAPTLASSTPADDATGVAVNSNIVLTFSEAVDTETGNIVIKKVSDNSTVESFDVATSTAISGSGTTTITINPTSDLASSTDYYIKIDTTAFDDAAGNSYAGISGATTLNFTTAAPTNTAPVANAGPDQTVASAVAVTLDGSGSSDADSGDTLTYAWTQTSGTTVTLSSATAQQPTFTAPSLNVGDADAVLVFSLVVNDSIVNSAADTVTITVEAPPPTPASEFAEHEAEIRNTLVGEASRSLRSSLNGNRRLAQSARDRFIEFGQAQEREEQVTRALIPLDFDGNFTLSETGLSTAGNFFQQVGNEEGTYRRLFFGDFDVQHDADTDSTTATLTGRMAWEKMTSEQTMLGYFIGGELATSTIGGSFEGDQDRIGVTAGGFVVHELAEQVYFDGFASVGAGRNNLEMSNDTLALESEYTTQTATLGGAITGVYSQKGYDFQPELAFSYGKTWLGNVGFTGRAYGLVDNTLSLDAGAVSVANLIFRPEVIIPIGAELVADSNTQFAFAPRLLCEQSKTTMDTSDCGTGGELGFSSTSEDGLSSADMRILLDRINGGTRSSFAFTIEHKF